jgi:sugar/nucleoside kinase (ribokinase family)
MDVICIGETLIDFIPGTEPASYIRNPGGGPANASVAMARNGLSVGIYSRLGNDDFGRFLKDTLEKENVKMLTPDLTDKAVTTMAFVTLYENGERSFTFARKPGADMLLSVEDIRDEDLEATKAVNGASFSMSENPEAEAVVHFLKRAHELNKLVAFDINYRDVVWDGNKAKAAEAVRGILPCVDLLKISEEEVDMIGGEEKIFDTMKEYSIAAVIETLGAQGARGFFDGQVIPVAGRKANAVDATGAGDAFWGGFISTLLNLGVRTPSDLTSDRILEAMNFGNVSGWCCVQTKGGMTSLPTRAQIEKVLEDERQ